MCGITGFFSPGREIDCGGFYDAHSLIRHRGPDDEGFVALTEHGSRSFRGDDSTAELAGLSHIRELAGSRVVLGHRRLSILDLSSLGHQPLVDPDGRYAIIFNGEVFNYLELRTTLAKLGHTFTGHSDTEVALRAYMEWGNDAFRRFNGMWAIAIWDIVGNRLVLSRDRFGIKPLYYSWIDGVLCFASEMKFIKAFAKKRWKLDDAACADYLYRMRLNCDQGTMIEGIEEVPPAHVMTVDANGIRMHQYWSLTPTETRRTLDDAVEELATLFRDSLSLRMRSDVEVGSLLSGGLDSSLIVCALHGLGFVPNERTFQTFAAVFEDEKYSEKKYVDAVAAQVPVAQSFVWPEAKRVAENIDKLLFHTEDPLRSLSPYLQYRLYEEIGHNTPVKVLLNGQGGDELFGGYTNHYFPHLANMAVQGRFLALARDAAAFHHHRGVSWRKIVHKTRRLMPEAHRDEAYFNRATYAEVTSGTLREYLKYDDRTSMAFGLETRPPFLDHRLVEFAFSLTDDMKIRGGETKRVEREYARGFVPPLVTERTDKMGFVSPQESWQRVELREDLQRISPILDQVVRFGTQEEQADARGRYRQYLQGELKDWTLPWRVFCLGRWLELNSSVLE